MGFFSALGSKLSNAANYVGRKVGQAAQFVGSKVSEGANAAANLADKIPGANVVGDALRSVGHVGGAINDAGKALQGGNGGLSGVKAAIGRGIGAAHQALTAFG